MPTVPYSSVPSRAPSLNTTPGIGLSVPGEAFGTGVAKAVQGLGHTIEQGSDQAGKLALDFQNLQNETWAKDQDVEVMIKIGQAQSEFDQLEGQNAVNALPGHMERIKAIRQEALDSSPNPMAKKMLDQSISRRVGFAIVDSGHKAGTQAKSANKIAGHAREEAAVATADPTQVGSMEMAERTIRSEIASRGEESGELPETTKNNTRKALDKMYLAAINKSAAVDPERAQAIFKTNEGTMSPEVREAARASVNRGMASKQTRFDADEIFDKVKFDPRKGPGQLEALLAESKKYAERKGKDNPEYGDFLDVRVRAKYGIAMQGFKDTQTGFEHTIGNFIMGSNDANRIVNIDAIVGPKAPPEIKSAYEGLEADGKRKVASWIKKASEGPISWTPERTREWDRLRGMASDPQSVEEFYNGGPELIYKANLPNAATRELLNLQRSIRGKAENIQLNQAMGQVQSMLNAAGVDRQQDPDSYWRFRGAMEDAMRDYQGEKKTKVPPEEVRKIASQLLRKQDGSWFFNAGATPVYAPSVPTMARAAIIDDLRDKGVFLSDPPTADQEVLIQRSYAHELFKRLYKQKATSESKGTPSPVGKSGKPNLEGLGQ